MSSGYYVRSRIESSHPEGGWLYNISTGREPAGFVLIRPDGTAYYFGNDGNELAKPEIFRPRWLAAVDEWLARTRLEPRPEVSGS
jgi:hypothetical protein